MQINIENENIEFVRNTILVNQCCKIIALCSECLVVPIKGISLLFSIYKNDYSRNVGDIDLLIPENKMDAFIKKLSGTGYTLRTQKMNSYRMKSKRKFDMVHHDSRYCDLDIHVDLINKKFFRLSVEGDFTSFALSRLKKAAYKGTTIYLLSPVDEWIYLAQHYCFHLFSNDKWLKDLYLIQRRFSEDDIAELVLITKKFHFERLVTAASRRLSTKYDKTEINIPEILTKKQFVFDLLFRKPNQKFAPTFSNRIIADYWEFIFIDNNKSRISAYLQLLFPQLTVLLDMYHFKSKTGCFFYPVHLLFVILSSILFFPLLIYSVK
ncbi:MAG: nucleotidyltransferase family protein [Dysgonamonadaceae bacterium]|jgi:hypothetical protein|nr:nucleotidyltransferase family protein [Dysgonamonadaceae bacterium]